MNRRNTTIYNNNGGQRPNLIPTLSCKCLVFLYHPHFTSLHKLLLRTARVAATMAEPLSLSLCLALVDTYASALNTTFYRLFKWQLEFNKGRLHYFFINAPNRGELQLTLQLLVAIIIATFLPISFVKVR